jgi:hypothetical protein
MKRALIVSLALLTLETGLSFPARAGPTDKLSVPFAFLVMEPGEGETAAPTLAPGPGKITFPEGFPYPFQYNYGMFLGSANYQFLPIWDRELIAFPQN